MVDSCETKSLVRTVENFLTESQVDSIKNEVHSMRKDWKNFHEYDCWQSDSLIHILQTQCLLGDAIYLAKEHEFNKDLQEKLKVRFDWLYQLTFTEIEKQFGLQVEFDDRLPVPGFHVFGGQDYNTITHVDLDVLEYYPEVSPGTVVSFISVIQCSETPAFLDIIIDDETWKHEERFEYKFGCLHFWNGMLPHRVGRFKLDDGEYRITFQGHFYVDPRSRIAKVYF